MPPRKRKAHQALPAIAEEAEAKSNKPSATKNDDVVMQDSQLSEIAQVHGAVRECKKQVESKAESIIGVARQRVQAFRADVEATIINRLPKQVRNTSVVDLLSLTPTEGASCVLHNLLPRLQALVGNPDDPDSMDAARIVASSLAAMTAAGGAQPMDVAGPSCSVHVGKQLQQQQQTNSQQAHPHQDQQLVTSNPHMQLKLSRQEQQHAQKEQEQSKSGKQKQQPSCSTGCAQVPALSPAKPLPEVARMPPPPPRLPLAAVNPPARLPMANEVLYSANGSPIHIGQLLPTAAAAKGVVAPCLPDAVPEAGTSGSAPPSMVTLPACKVRRVAPTRSRAKQPSRSVTVTTQDGKSFTVDDLNGLAAVPQAYRNEVRRLVEADLQHLSAIAQSMTLDQENSNVAAASGTASTSQPKRRR